MALIQDFKHDIFISYAHVDNESAFQGQGPWIELFCEGLKVLLGKRFGHTDTVKIWWDKERLDGGVDFNDAIANAVENSAVMICLNSPGYRESDYCKKELELFHLKASNEKVGLKITNRPRIINILLDDEDYQHWLPEFNKTTGFHFHDGDFPLETDNPEFKKRMKEFVKPLETLLREFQKIEPTPTPDPQAEVIGNEKEDFTIFLADVPDTLRSSRKRITSELDKAGYKVIADIPPPYEALAHEQRVKEAIKEADLAVHLLDEYPGREIEGSPGLWYPQKQTEISLEDSTPTMIWTPEDLNVSEIEEEAYGTFLQSIESRNFNANTYDFIRGSKSNAAHIVIERAKEIQQQKIISVNKTDDLSVLLDTHMKDMFYASELNNTLQENSIRAFLNPNEDEPEKNIDQLEDRISRVKKLIFLYGSVTRDWLLERISIALRIIINGGYDIEDFIVYMSPPFKSKDEIAINQRLVKLNIIDGSNFKGIDQAILNALKADSK